MSHHEPESNEVTKTTDETEITIKPRGFNIVWGKDTRYWQLPERSTEAPAELKQVCWLEITGSVDVKPGNKYTIEFQVSMKPDAFGWSGCPVFMMAKNNMNMNMMCLNFEQGAVMVQVNWFEVTGKLSIMPNNMASGEYEIVYIVKFRADAFGLHKFNNEPERVKSLLLESYRSSDQVA
ncbi:hypothetical protein QYF36_013540 [Acer negundo]|nr:hypothetical protein QYF36_013540 [Acer negundo]